MGTNNFYRSALPKIHSIVENAMILYPKELVIATLRKFFSDDDYYAYHYDSWGYPKTPDLTGTAQDAGYNDTVSTRLFIGESYRFDVIYYPAIIVKHGGSASVPLSINRETDCIQWKFIVVEDGYGNITKYPTPAYFIFAGAWEGTINIDVRARDLRARDDLVDLISILFVDVAFNDLQKSGLIVSNVSVSAPTETDDRNDKVFTQTITLKIRSEWRRHIPIDNLVDIINVGIEFASIDPPGPVATNLTINLNQTLTDMINDII